MKVFDFQSKLRDVLDDAVSITFNSKNYDQGLDIGTAMLEEVLAEEVARIITTTLTEMMNDLSKLERQILADVEELRDRKRKREEDITQQLDMGGKVTDCTYKYFEGRGKDAGQEH